MTILEGVLQGVIQGLTEFLPVSSQAHQRIMDHIFGNTFSDPVRSLFIHIGIFLCLMLTMQQNLIQLKRNRKHKRARREAPGLNSATMDYSLVKNAAIPMMICMLALSFATKRNLSIPVICVMLLINGMILLVSERSMKGNRDAKHMSVFDSWLIGIASGASALPGISAFGMGTSVALMRGADKRKTVTWMLLLGIPALLAWILLDFVAILSLTAPVYFFGNLFGYISSGIFAYLGAMLSIYLIRTVSAHSGYMGFVYYSWGAALFTFILYLIVA